MTTPDPSDTLPPTRDDWKPFLLGVLCDSLRAEHASGYDAGYQLEVVEAEPNGSGENYVIVELVPTTLGLHMGAGTRRYRITLEREIASEPAPVHFPPGTVRGE